MKNNVNQKTVAVSMGYVKSIVTVDTYTDMQAIIEDCEEEIQELIEDVHPYDSADVQMLKEMFQEEVDFQEEKFFNFPLVFICLFWYNWKRTNVLNKNSHTDFPYRLLCAILCYGILNSTAWSGKSVLVTLFV